MNAATDGRTLSREVRSQLRKNLLLLHRSAEAQRRRSQLRVAAHCDPVVAAAFQKVVNMLAPPPSVVAPHVMLRVLRGNLRVGRASASRTNSVAPRATAG